MTDTTHRRVRFEGDRYAEAPATWAQQSMWNTICRMRPNDAYFNARFAVPVPVGTSIDDICRVVSDCVSHHESLRTLYLVATDGRISQLVQRSGELSVAVVELEEATAESLLEKFAEKSFKHDSELPVRFTVVTRKGHPSHLLTIGSHISLDGIGKELLRQEIVACLAGRQPLRDDFRPISSVDRAVAEQSPEGQARNSAVVARWRRLLDTYEVTSFPTECRPDINPRWLVSSMSSPALGLGVDRIAQRCRVTTPAVYMAASAVMIAALSGYKTVVVKSMISNRFSVAEKMFVGNLSQPCACAIEVGESHFDDVVRRTMLASLRAYSMGCYDCEDVYRMVEPHRFDAFHNNLRMADGMARRAAPVHVGDILSLKSATTVSTPEPLTVHGSKLYVEIRDTGLGPEALLVTDGRYVPVTRPDQLLSTMADFVIAAAITESAASAVNSFLEALALHE